MGIALKSAQGDIVKFSNENADLARTADYLGREVKTKDVLLATRAGTLLRKGAEFICIDAEEPYYLEAYRTIRQYAKMRGTWTEACETDFRVRLERWLDRASVKERRVFEVGPGPVETK